MNSNPTLKEIHGLLIAQHTTLSQKLEDETDANKANAILTEMQEILHRIDMIEGLLLRSSSKALEGILVNIREADTALTQTIKSIEDVTGFINSAAKFLTYVDKAIDIAKKLAPLAGV